MQPMKKENSKSKKSGFPRSSHQKSELTGGKRPKHPEKKGLEKAEKSGAGLKRSGQARVSLMLRAFKHKNYRLFFSGQLLSLIGTWMQSMAQMWLVYKLTHSAVALGLVGFAGQIPVLLFSTFGGVVADRTNRHRILLGTQTASMVLAFILSLLTMTHWVQVWHIYTLAALLGLVNAFDIPTRQSFIVEMVGKEDLINAIALNSSMFNSARIVGPALGGILVAAVGEGWCFFLNGVSYVAVIAGLLLMELRPRKQHLGSGSTLSSIVEGFVYIRQKKPVRDLLILLGLISLMGMPYLTLMPIFAARILHGDAGALGMLMGASGLGSLIAALLLAARREVRGLGRVVALSAGGFGFFLILFSLSRQFWLSAGLLIPVGFSMVTQMAASNTLIQSLIPDRFRGRVMAAYSMMLLGMAPFGALLGGTVAHHIGAPGTVALGGAVCILAALVFGWRLPSLREEGRKMFLELKAERDREHHGNE
jgi:MFS family permease